MINILALQCSSFNTHQHVNARTPTAPSTPMSNIVRRRKIQKTEAYHGNTQSIMSMERSPGLTAIMTVVGYMKAQEITIITALVNVRGKAEAPEDGRDPEP